jgi:hypothetical protein
MHRRPRLPRPFVLRPTALVLALAAASLASPATAQTAGPGGINFWNTPVDGSWFDPLAWNGVLPSQGGVPDSTQTAHISFPVTVTLGQRGECHHLSLGQAGVVLRIRPDAGYPFSNHLVMHGTQLDNNGLLDIGLAGATQSSALIINNHTTAAGTGRIRLAEDTRQASINPNNNLGWLLVNGAGHTIEGNGELTVRLHNDGLVHANVAGRTLRVNGSHTVTNNATFRVSNGATLNISQANGASVFEQSSTGRILVEVGSTLLLNNSGNDGIRGGELTTLGGGQALVQSQGVRIEGVTLTGGSRLGFIGNAGIFIGPAGMTNDGLIATGPSGFVASRFGESTTVRGSGRLQLEGGALSSLFGGGGYAMVNDAGHTIGGVGTIALALTNRGVLLADRNGASSGASELQLQTSAQANEGLMAATGGGVLVLSMTPLAQTANGVLEARDGSAIVLSGSTVAASVTGGTLRTEGSGVIVAGGGNDRLVDLRIDTGARVLAPCSRTLDLAGTVVNDGTITVDNSGCGPSFANLRATTNTTLAGNGSVRLRANAAGAPARLVGQGGRLSLGPAQALTGSGRGQGALALQGLVSLDQPFAPAGDIGTLTLDGGTDLRLAPTTVIDLDIAGPGSFDRIDGNGAITLDGTLVVTLANGYLPAVGATFDFAVGSSVSGRPHTIVPPAAITADARVELLADRARLVITPPMFRDGFESP